MKSKLSAKIRSTDENTPTKEYLTTGELKTSQTIWIKEAQSLDAKIKAKEFQMLSPFTDDEGIIRIGGRIDDALVSSSFQKMIYLQTFIQK